ncbi:10566_t:CDS:2, partial [Ambispora leptoticha]
ILRNIIREKVDWYLDKIVLQMEIQCGKHVSVSTLWCSLAYCGITRKKLHKAAKERNELLRSAFMLRIDESSKDERTISRGYGYSETNTRAVKKTVFVRGVRYTLLPALTLDGIIAVDIMEGSCSKIRFKEFVISQVLPQMNSYPHARSVLVLDNARIHHDDRLLEYLDAFGIRVEFLPPYSPDLNPIETAFSYIKHSSKTKASSLLTSPLQSNLIQQPECSGQLYAVPLFYNQFQMFSPYIPSQIYETPFQTSIQIPSQSATSVGMTLPTISNFLKQVDENENFEKCGVDTIGAQETLRHYAAKYNTVYTLPHNSAHL